MSHEPDNPVTLDQPDEFDLPAGNHPLEVAARRGFGPLSPMSAQAWHGQAKPCVSCGQLVERDAAACDACGQDLREEMLEKMRQHAGPWYVLEHLRPFPGVSLERIVRQIRRGLITETSIVRGPATDYQWRFAVETPSLCRYFGRCWNCHHDVSPSDSYCPSCLTHLSFQRFPEPREPETARPPIGTEAASVQPRAAQSVGTPPGLAGASRGHSLAELTKPLVSQNTNRPVTTGDLAKPLGRSEGVRPSSGAAGVAPRMFSPPITQAGGPATALPRHDPVGETGLPFEPRPAAPVASAIGLPDSTPVFGPSHRTVAPGASAATQAAGARAGLASSSASNPLWGSSPSAQSSLSAGRATSAPAARANSPELARLASAVASFEQTPREEPAGPAIPRTAWIAGVIAVIAVVTLIALASS